jgi:hypothetical protein
MVQHELVPGSIFRWLVLLRRVGDFFCSFGTWKFF